MADSSLSGVGSGIDTSALITGLVNADSGRLSALKTKQTATQSAVSTLSDISSALGSLQTAVDALSTANGVGSYTGTSSSPAIAISTSGNALPGSYQMSVTQLAKAQRTYSDAQTSASTALGFGGNLTIQVGTGQATSINIGGTDTLDEITAKINSSGLRVGASTFFDGTSYRLQIRGLDTGKDNKLTITENGFDLGLNAAANTVQQAQNSIVKIDGFDVERSTNQVVGAIQGVTLALTNTTTAPVDVSVSTDSGGLAGKINAIVTAYNSVLGKINTAAGTSSVKAGNAELAGDSTLRSIMNRLRSAIQTNSGSGGAYTTLGSVGLSLQKDGKLSLDQTKLSTALTADPAAVSTLFAGGNTSTGVMSTLSKAIKSYNQTGTGLLSTHSADMQGRIKTLTTRMDREQDRLDRYRVLLQKQFTAMDTSVTTNNNMMGYLSKISTSTS